MNAAMLAAVGLSMIYIISQVETIDTLGIGSDTKGTDGRFYFSKFIH